MTGGTDQGTSALSSRRRFRDLLAEARCTVQPAVYDPLGGLVVSSLGFRAIGLGGYALGAHLGIPEPMLSLEDVATAARYITLAVDLPLMVDVGAGWGDPAHVTHTIRVIERTGAASVHLEDQLYPKRVHYHKGVEHVIPEAEMVAKVKAAVRARHDPEFAIVARTDAMRTDGFDEGIRRAGAYIDAGADAIMAFPNTEEEAQRTPRELPGVALVYVNSEGNRLERPVPSVNALEHWGWRVVSYPATAVMVTSSAIRDVFSKIRDEGTSGLDPIEMIAVRKGIEDLMGLDAYYALEADTVERD